jgi:hypothetical protein
VAGTRKEGGKKRGVRKEVRKQGGTWGGEEKVQEDRARRIEGRRRKGTKEEEDGEEGKVAGKMWIIENGEGKKGKQVQLELDPWDKNEGIKIFQQLTLHTHHFCHIVQSTMYM